MKQHMKSQQMSESVCAEAKRAAGPSTGLSASSGRLSRSSLPRGRPPGAVGRPLKDGRRVAVPVGPSTDRVGLLVGPAFPGPPKSARLSEFIHVSTSTRLKGEKAFRLVKPAGRAYACIQTRT